MIGTAISIGMTVGEIRSFYHGSGREMFDRVNFWTQIGSRFGYQYHDKKLAQLLQHIFGRETTLGSERLKTLLMIVMHNAHTDSPWPVTNNPKAQYNDLERNGSDSNLHLPLWQLLRASTAAPTYFPPEKIKVGKKEYLFLDGAVTPYNNPALQAYIMSTLHAYNIGWEKGEDKLLIVSVGTGGTSLTMPTLRAEQMHLLHHARKTPHHIINAIAYQQDMLCRVFGNCLAGEPLDREISDLKAATGAGCIDEKLFTYLRYNMELNQKGLNALGVNHIHPKEVSRLDATDKIHCFEEIGQKIAEQQVAAWHFAGF